MHLTVVGLATVPEGGPTAVPVPLVVHILKFVKHGLALAATARLAKHLAMCHCHGHAPREASTRAASPIARVAHGRPKVAEDDKQHPAFTNALATPWACHINVPPLITRTLAITSKQKFKL